ncbi:MAG: hypothetical protein CME64_02880 [Halobacteriovoraceae bacterium]|nr:hypothetical protein [Halobacteriovoraceae bacterium]|tara:strand:+ start:25325 stop:26545 length:1221 start_codon:yes stop_codon:yes gene_type:complete
MAISHANTLKSDEFFLSKGEQVEINIKNLNSFSIGNKEVITSKFYAAKSKLLVKGKSLGFSDLVIWSHSGKKRNIHFYVVSKREQLKTFQLANDFKSLGLKVKALAFELLISGELDSPRDLRMFTLYMERSKERVISTVSISKKLRKQIIKEIYLKLRNTSRGLICNSNATSIECLYEKLDIESTRVKKLAQAYNIKFIPKSQSFVKDNFLVEMKIVKIDNTDLSTMGFGLNRFSSTFSELLNSGPKAIVAENEVSLSNQKLFSKVVSSPSILTTIGKASKVQLGAEIPITTRHRSGQTSTTFKFAGLQIISSLMLNQKKLRIHLSTELTYPVGQLVRGSKSESDFFPKLGKYAKAFQISYNATSQTTQAVPGLSKIPIIKHLFSSSDNQNSIQWLVGYIKVTRLK